VSTELVKKKSSKQIYNYLKANINKFNIDIRPSKWKTAPNSGTWWEDNKGLCSLLQQESE
jgi:hypothetical protein